MDTASLFLLLVITEGGLCFFLSNFEEKAQGDKVLFENLHRHGKARESDLSAYDHLTPSHKIIKDDKTRNEEPSVETQEPGPITATITSSGQASNGDVILTITTVPYLNIWWSYIDMATYTRVETFGEIRSNTSSTSISSSFKYNTDMYSVYAYLAGNRFYASFPIIHNEMMTARTENLTDLIELLEEPYSVEMLEGNILQFDMMQSNIEPYVQTMFESFVEGESYPEMKFIDTEVFETNEQNVHRVRCYLDNLELNNGHLFVRYAFKETSKFVFVTTVTKSIPIQSINQNEIGDFLMITSMPYRGPKIYRLAPAFRSGSLACHAMGKPIPRLEFLKDGVLQESNTVSLFGLVSIGFLSFDGQSLDDVAGTYVCQATSGNKTLSLEYLVKKYEENESNYVIN